MGESAAGKKQIPVHYHPNKSDTFPASILRATRFDPSYVGSLKT